MTVLAEKEDLERELLFTRQAFEQASDSIHLFRRDGSIYQTNRTAEELLGYRREELAGLSVYDVNPSLTGCGERCGKNPNTAEKSASDLCTGGMTEPSSMSTSPAPPGNRNTHPAMGPTSCHSDGTHDITYRNEAPLQALLPVVTQ